MTYLVYVEGILGVEINQPSFEWSYGTVAPPASHDDFSACLLKVHIRVRPDNLVFRDQPMQSTLGRYHYFSADAGANTIQYERDFFFGRKLRYCISKHDNDVYVTVGKSYMRFVRHRIMGLHSLAYTLTDLVSGMLLQNGVATLHCSAFGTKSQNIVCFAPPNTGKTLTAMQLCLNHGFDFIAEDFALTDGVNLWSVPWTSTFRYYDAINESAVARLVNRVTRFIPVLELVTTTKPRPVDTYFDSSRIRQTSVATDVVLLERGSSDSDQDKSEGLRKAINLNRYEFNFHKAPSVVVMDYFNPGFSPVNMAEEESRILGTLIENCVFWRLREPSALLFTDAVLEKVVRE